MNRLNIMEGVGHPLKQDDIDFLQTALKDGIDGLLTPFAASNDCVILSGCTITDDGVNPLNIAAGWVSYKGEIMKVDAHTAPRGLADNAYAWVLVESNIGGPTVYADGTSHYVYKQRRAELQQYVAQVDYVTGKSRTSLADAVRGMVIGSYNLLTLLNGWAFSSRPVEYAQVGIRVTLKGVLNSAAVTGAVFATLPAAARPNVDIYRPIINDQTELYCLKIATTGDMSILTPGGGGTTAALYFLDEVMFDIL